MKNETPDLSARGMEDKHNVTMPNAAPTVKIDETANSSAAQRGRLLAALRRESLTTLEARRKLDMMHPAARVMELRHLGFRIDTIWTTDLTTEGKPHRVARYLLRQGEASE